MRMRWAQSWLKSSRTLRKNKDRVAIEVFNHLAMSPSDWGKHGYYSTEILESLQKNHTDNIQRVNYSDISVEEFYQRFDIPQIPCIIKGVPEAEGWEHDKN